MLHENDSISHVANPRSIQKIGFLFRIIVRRMRWKGKAITFLLLSWAQLDWRMTLSWRVFSIFCRKSLQLAIKPDLFPTKAFLGFWTNSKYNLNQRQRPLFLCSQNQVVYTHSTVLAIHQTHSRAVAMGVVKDENNGKVGSLATYQLGIFGLQVTEKPQAVRPNLTTLAVSSRPLLLGAW